MAFKNYRNNFAAVKDSSLHVGVTVHKPLREIVINQEVCMTIVYENSALS